MLSGVSTRAWNLPPRGTFGSISALDRGSGPGPKLRRVWSVPAPPVETTHRSDFSHPIGLAGFLKARTSRASVARPKLDGNRRMGRSHLPDPAARVLTQPLSGFPPREASDFRPEGHSNSAPAALPTSSSGRNRPNRCIGSLPAVRSGLRTSSGPAFPPCHLGPSRSFNRFVSRRRLETGPKTFRSWETRSRSSIRPKTSLTSFPCRPAPFGSARCRASPL